MFLSLCKVAVARCNDGDEVIKAERSSELNVEDKLASMLVALQSQGLFSPTPQLGKGPEAHGHQVPIRCQ